MAAGATYFPLSTTTLASAANSVTFSSIPSTYTDLVIVVQGIESGGSGDFINVQYNSDTGTNYSSTMLSGNGSAAQSFRYTSLSSARFGAFYTTEQANAIISIQNYSNTTTYKTAISRSNSAGTNTLAFITLWRNTSAITSIKVLIESNNFASGTTFTLYGIAAA